MNHKAMEGSKSLQNYVTRIVYDAPLALLCGEEFRSICRPDSALVLMNSAGLLLLRRLFSCNQIATSVRPRRCRLFLQCLVVFREERGFAVRSHQNSLRLSLAGSMRSAHSFLGRSPPDGLVRR